MLVHRMIPLGAALIVLLSPAFAREDAPAGGVRLETPSPMAALQMASAKRTRGPMGTSPALAEAAPRRGVTRDAEEAYTPDPDPSLLNRRLKNLAPTVEVTVDVDGAHSERLVRSTGDKEADRLLLQALQQWRWRAATKDGIPVRSAKTITLRLETLRNPG